jgi:hypothetical protein
MITDISQDKRERISVANSPNRHFFSTRSPVLSQSQNERVIAHLIMLLKAFLFFTAWAVGFVMPPDAIGGVYYVGMTLQGQMRTPLSERALNETGPSPFRSQYYSDQNLVSVAVCTNAHLDWPELTMRWPNSNTKAGLLTFGEMELFMF